MKSCNCKGFNYTIFRAQSNILENLGLYIHIKKTLLALLIGTLALPLAAQPNITSGSFDFSKTARYFTNSDSINPNLVPPANNAIWDYRFLTARAFDTVIFSKKNNSDFVSAFPLANEVIEEYTAWLGNRAIERHNYKDSQVYLNYGGVSLPSSIFYNKPAQLLLKFPFVFNSSFYNSLYGIVTYDGYGTLQLPSGTYNNVYRTTTFDSIATFNQWYTYNWFDSARRLLTIYINSTNKKTTFYSPYTSASGISSTKINTQPLVFPNPSEGPFTIQNTVVGDKIEIYNALGQLVMQEITVAQQHSFFLDKKGVYIIKVSTKNGVVTDRLFVKIGYTRNQS